MQGNIVFANELFRRYGDQGIVSTSVHPGNIKTDLYQGVPLMVSLVVRPLFLHLLLNPSIHVVKIRASLCTLLLQAL